MPIQKRAVRLTPALAGVATPPVGVPAAGRLIGGVLGVF